MNTLYDLLGANADDDAEAIKKAFYRAVKAHHPDLHPDDPDAPSRFMQIVGAHALLRDPKQRARYDRALQLERQQYQFKLEYPQAWSQFERRRLRTKKKRIAAAVVGVAALASAYEVFSPISTTAILAFQKDDHAATATETTGNHRDAATAVAAVKADDNTPAASATAKADGNTPAASATAKADDNTQAASATAKADGNSRAGSAAAKADGNTPAASATAKADGNTPAASATAKADDNTQAASATAKADDNTQAASATAKADAMGSRTDVVRRPAVAQLVERPAERGEPRGKEDGAEVPDAVIRPSTDASATDSGKTLVVAEAEPVLAPLSNDANFYRQRGIDAYRSGDFLGAVGNFDEAIRLDPGDAQSYNFRGNVWDELGIVERALADYDEAIRIDPNNPAIFLDRAVLWQGRGQLDKALVDLDRAIRFSFSNVDMYCGRGLVWNKKGRHDRALADFNHAIKLDSNAAAACIKRGLILHRHGGFNAAFAAGAKAIRVDPSLFDALGQANSRR